MWADNFKLFLAAALGKKFNIKFLLDLWNLVQN